MSGPVPYRGNYIAGRFLRPSKGVELVSQDPGDLLHPVGRVFTSESAVAPAVAAARATLPKWRALPLKRRAAFLKTFQKVLRKRQAEWIHLLAREAGKPLPESRREIERLTAKVDEMLGAGVGRLRPFTLPVGPGVKGRCLTRPIGVVAVIGPFNFPAHTPATHILPALLFGNTVVFKPSELTPFVGQWIAEALAAAKLPAGVFNLVQGGSKVGEVLARQPELDGLFFTGSTAAGQAIRTATFKNSRILLAMEMGGKNAACVLPDADLDLAAAEVTQAAFSMAGQRCNATSRVIVHKSVAGKFLERFLALTDRATIGYPAADPVLMGPLISHDAVAKLQRYRKLAREEGFEPVRAGKGLGSWGKRRGYYVTPSVHLCEKPARNKSVHYRKEEIFGPDVAVYVARDEEEIVRLNNEVPYGLITAVFTKRKG
ncbi:MAG: N-succinylglutamate 5-semialdehyde dehydrogenase, partial [Candidatus Omnitrophica bacterium CG11_big_fil_rev_8_21_14_0_20_64_10]